MNPGPVFAMTLVAALGSGLIAGVFFAFSSFVMPALDRLPPAQGAAAMQSINVTAVTPPLMAPLFGTALVCGALILAATRRWDQPGAVWLLAGGLFYLVGVVGVTIVCNVPRNDALAAVDPVTPAGADAWARYVPGWTGWNTVRTAAGLAAAAAFTIALVVG